MNEILKSGYDNDIEDALVEVYADTDDPGELRALRMRRALELACEHGLIGRPDDGMPSLDSMLYRAGPDLMGKPMDEVIRYLDLLQEEIRREYTAPVRIVASDGNEYEIDPSRISFEYHCDGDTMTVGMTATPVAGQTIGGRQ